MRADGGGRQQLQHDQAAIAWIHQHEWIAPRAGAGQGAGCESACDLTPVIVGNLIWLVSAVESGDA